MSSRRSTCSATTGSAVSPPRGPPRAALAAELSVSSGRRRCPERQRREDELLAAYRVAAQHVFARLPVIGADQDWAQAAEETLRGLAGALAEEPDAASVLLVGGLAGGQRMREQRRSVLDEFERRIRVILDGRPKNGTVLDLLPSAVTGALRSIIAVHLRSAAGGRGAQLVRDALAWMGSYATPLTDDLCSSGPSGLLPPADRRAGRGRCTPKPAGAPSQRERLILATAEVMTERGYTRARVRDITARAGVSQEVFDQHFRSKQQAFIEAEGYHSQRLLDACAASYFNAHDWPEGVWRCLHTLLELMVSSPAISHLWLVECYPAGPDAIRRAEEITRPFEFFLQPGYTHRSDGRSLPHVFTDAIMGAVFEILRRDVERGELTRLPRRLPQLAHLVITPFLGHRDANSLIKRLSTDAITLRHGT